MTCFEKLSKDTWYQGCLIINNLLLLCRSCVELMVNSGSTLLVVSLVIYSLLLLVQIYLLQSRRQMNQVWYHSQMIILVILLTESTLHSKITALLQLMISDVYYIQREDFFKWKHPITFMIIVSLNLYVFIRLAFFDMDDAYEMVFELLQTILLKFFITHPTTVPRSELTTDHKNSQKMANIDPPEELISSLRASNFQTEKNDFFIYKAFDILPQGVVILDKNCRGQFKLKYSNHAAQSQFGQQDDTILDVILKLRGVRALGTQKDEYRLGLSSASQGSMYQSKQHQSTRFIQKTLPFKYSTTFIHDHINSAVLKSENQPEGLQRYPSVQAVSVKKPHETPRSPELQQCTPSRRASLEDNETLENLLESMWAQLLQEMAEKHLISEQIIYVHESDTFVTSTKKGNKQKQCLDLKVFTSVHQRNPMLVIVFRDVTHRDYIKILSDYNKEKSKTLSFVSHEFRTPLSCIIVMLETVIENRSITSVEDLTMVKSAIDNCKYILNLSNDLLDFSQIKQGKFKVNFTKFNLHNLLRDCLNLFDIQARRKNVALNFFYESNVPTEIVNDQNRIRQVTINLIGNALKFTLKGSVTLRIQVQEERLYCVEVTDTGIGMKVEDQPKLFQAFSKIENKETSQLNAQGVGLGLLISNSISQSLNTGHSGLGFRSDYQKGSEFRFLVSDFIQSYIEDFEMIEDSSGEVDLDTKMNEVRRQSQNLKKFIIQMNVCACANVLIVDDNQFNIDALMMMIHRSYKEKLKCDYTICGSLAEEMVRQRFIKTTHSCQPYRLIFMDVEMPFQNGIVTSRNIRQIYQNFKATVSIIGCSGYVQEKQKQECKEFMNDYIIKPVQKTDLERIFNVYYFQH